MHEAHLALLAGPALDITCRAGALALQHFQTALAVETKADLSPVTLADRACERFLREHLGRMCPGHGICGEEFGRSNATAEYRWWLDPIDGTQSFIRGVPIFGVMVGLEHNGEALLGIVDFPALGETVWAWRGGGAWWRRKGQTVPARVSGTTRLQDATLLYTDPRGFASAGRAPAWEKLRAAARFERTWGDCYGHALVATGRADLMLDPVLNPWDACALLPIVTEAGGHFFDWSGRADLHGGSGISTNGSLAAPLRALLSN